MRKASAMIRKSKLGLIVLGTIVVVLTAAADVMAIVGRPATPFSYASVARRSVRRAYY